jgi:hypothetical protein
VKVLSQREQACARLRAFVSFTMGALAVISQRLDRQLQFCPTLMSARIELFAFAWMMKLQSSTT